MKILHIIVALLFIAFAVVQLNDPDPLGWVLIYLAVAATALLYLLKKDITILAISGLVVCGVGMALLIPDFFYWLTHGMPTITGAMKAESLYIELVREFLGFLIAAIVFFFYFRAHLAKGNCC